MNIKELIGQIEDLEVIEAEIQETIKSVEALGTDNVRTDSFLEKAEDALQDALMDIQERITEHKEDIEELERLESESED